MDDVRVTLYREFGSSRTPAVSVHTTAVVPSAVALPLTRAPVKAFVTTIESAVTDAGSIPGVNDARMLVVSATSLVTLPAVSAPCDGGSPLRTTTLPRTGGCGTMARSTCTTASAAGDEVWTYATPSPVEVCRGTSENGAAG